MTDFFQSVFTEDYQYDIEKKGQHQDTDTHPLEREDKITKTEEVALGTPVSLYIEKDKEEPEDKAELQHRSTSFCKGRTTARYWQTINVRGG